MNPTPYPRIPHLVEDRGSRDDLVLRPDQVRSLLQREVVVEEKLDGANVVLWLEDGWVQAATRGGPGASDRAGQLGPLRAWTAQHADALRNVLLQGASVLYGEWLLLSHTVTYDRLPSFLVVLDLLLVDGAFAGVDERDERCGGAGLHTPPLLARGVLGGVAAVEALLGQSAVGSGPAEGLIMRAVDGRPPRLAKLVRPGFDRLGDESWRAGRPRNRLADWEGSWR